MFTNESSFYTKQCLPFLEKSFFSNLVNLFDATRSTLSILINGDSFISSSPNVETRMTETDFYKNPFSSNMQFLMRFRHLFNMDWNRDDNACLYQCSGKSRHQRLLLFVALLSRYLLQLKPIVKSSTMSIAQLREFELYQNLFINGL